MASLTFSSLLNFESHTSCASVTCPTALSSISVQQSSQVLTTDIYTCTGMPVSALRQGMCGVNIGIQPKNGNEVI